VGRPVSAETLIDRVWGERAPAGARRALHAHIARIRTVLRDARPPWALVHRSGGYVLEAQPDRVDWHRFRRLVTTAGSHPLDDHQRADLLRQALELWRGPPLADVRPA
jgi:DNA-binding SARP family transcriptional activator